MWRFAGRNAAVVGASLAALLFFMQLRAEGARGYELADVLSILLFAVPTLLQRVRPSDPRPPRPRRAAAGHPSEPPVPPAETVTPSRPRTTPDARALLIERVAVYAVASIIAGGSYVLLVVLVLLQAWAPALSAALVCASGVAAMPQHDATQPGSQPTPDADA